MNTKHGFRVLSVLIVFLMLLSCGDDELIPATGYSVISLKGSAKLLLGGKTESMQVGSVLSEGDRMIVTSGSTVKLQSVQGLVSEIDGRAEIRVEEFSSSGGALRSKIFLKRGRSYFNLSHFNLSKFLKESRFEVITPTAVISGRGTAFYVEVDSGGKTRVVVAEGKVNIRRFVSKENAASMKELTKKLVEQETAPIEREQELSLSQKALERAIIGIERSPDKAKAILRREVPLYPRKSIAYPTMNRARSLKPTDAEKVLRPIESDEPEKKVIREPAAVIPKPAARWSSDGLNVVRTAPHKNGVLVVTREGNIRNFSKDGTALWSMRLAGITDGSLLVAKNRVYAGDSFYEFTCFDLATGKKLWRRTLKGRLERGIDPVFSGGFIFAAVTSGDVYKIRPENGVLIWSKSVPSGVVAAPAASGSLWVPAANGTLVGFNMASGVVEKTVTLSSKVAPGGLINVDGTVITPLRDGRVLGISGNSGGTKFSVSLGSAVDARPVVVGERIVLHLANGKIAIISKDGKKVAGIDGVSLGGRDIPVVTGLLYLTKGGRLSVFDLRGRLLESYSSGAKVFPGQESVLLSAPGRLTALK